VNQEDRMNDTYRHKHAVISTEEGVVDRAKVIVDEKRCSQ